MNPNNYRNIMILKIKEMVENGFATKRISKILILSEKEIKEIIQKNNLGINKEKFELNKISHICNLYEQGVSAKSLGIKYSIDKRRIQKWVKEFGNLRDINSSHRFTEFNQNYFDNIDSEEKAYWLGFFYADAYNCNTTNTFSLTLKQEDYSHIIKLCNLIGLPESKVIKYNSNIDDKLYPSCYVKLYSKHLCNKMNELGCPQAKSFIIKYPNWLDKTLNVHFIRGMFDGDGCLTKRKTTNEWKWSLVSTKECCESIQKIILNELDISLTLDYISQTKNNTYCLVTNGNEKILKLSSYLYENALENSRLSRKYNKYLELIEQQDSRRFSRKQYKISEEEKDEMLIKINNGDKLIDIANFHDVHQRTVGKIKANNGKNN